MSQLFALRMRVKNLEMENGKLQDKLATLEDGIRRHRNAMLTSRYEGDADERLYALLDASHDQEETDGSS